MASAAIEKPRVGKWHEINLELRSLKVQEQLAEQDLRVARSRLAEKEKEIGCDHDAHSHYSVAAPKITKGCTQCDRLELVNLGRRDY